jgi:glucuronate isomerase
MKEIFLIRRHAGGSVNLNTPLPDDYFCDKIKDTWWPDKGVATEFTSYPNAVAKLGDMAEEERLYSIEKYFIKA